MENDGDTILLLKYQKTCITSLEKELKQKDIEIGQLKSYIQELEDERKASGDDLQRLKKDHLIKTKNQEINKLKKDNWKLVKDNKDLVHQIVLLNNNKDGD